MVCTQALLLLVQWQFLLTNRQADRDLARGVDVDGNGDVNRGSGNELRLVVGMIHCRRNDLVQIHIS